MAKKDEKAKRRKVLREKKADERQRVVKYRAGKDTHVLKHPTGKGYDVNMVRDFLDHLLLEVRVQQYENQLALRGMEAGLDATSANDEVKAKEAKIIDEQFTHYLKKYECALISTNVIDDKGATSEEKDRFVKKLYQLNIARREEQIGHLEALAGLFDEALSCAKYPFGPTADGNMAMPHRVWRVARYKDSKDPNELDF